MRRLSVLLLSVPALLFWCLPPLYAQDYQQMRRNLIEKQRSTQHEIIQLKSQIESYRKQFTATENKFEETRKHYEALNKEIILRNALIKKLQKEQQTVQHEIEVTQQAYQEKEQELNKLILQYQHTLTYLYTHGRETSLALLLTSHSVNQMLVRAYYLRKFAQFRKGQEDRIREDEQQLEARRKDLEASQKEKKELLGETRGEKEDLEQRSKLQQNMIADIRKDRGRLKKMIKDTRRQVDDLNSTLTKLIAQAEKVQMAEERRLRRLEAERQQKLAAAEKIKDPSKRAEMVKRYSAPIVDRNKITKAEINTFQKEFASEKGKLPWPVDGIVTAHFGIVVHPLYGTKISNLGIDIAAPPATPVHAVSDGYVFAIQPITGYGDLVFVNHGRYKTIYGNLSQVLVHKNMIVRQGDVIGLSGDKNSARGEVLFFMIHVGKKNVDPESWLKDR